MASLSTEERELALINKVEMRIALTKTDEKLASLLNTYLAPLLLKLSSEHLAVRNKIISICQHVNTRVKDPSVQLPVEALLKQFKEQQSTLIRHFDLLYIKQGALRLTDRERAGLVPVLIKGISKDTATPNQTGSSLFHLLLQALQFFQLPLKGSQEDDSLRQTLEMSREDGELVSAWFGKLILVPNARRSTSSGTVPVTPGLSAEDFDFLTVFGEPDVWDPSSKGGLHLAKTKILVLRFLATGAFTDEERFLPALFASADTNSLIAERGDDILKKAISSVDMSETSLISRLYALHLGGEKSSAVTPALQVKILSYLSRSTASTTFPNEFLQIVTRGVAMDDDNSSRGREGSKLRSAIFAYANYFLRNAKVSDLEIVTKLLVTRLSDFISRQGWPVPESNQDLGLRRLAYELIGLSAKAGKIADLKLLRWFFQSLREDSSGKETAVSIEEGLSSLIGVFAEYSKTGTQAAPRDVVTIADSGVCSTMTDSNESADLQALSEIFMENMSLPSLGNENYRRSSRYVAVRFANRCLPYNHVVGRWIAILAVGGPPGESQEVAEEGRKGLNPYWFKMLNSDRPDLWQNQLHAQEDVHFPDFAKLFDKIFPREIRGNEYEEENAALIHGFLGKDMSVLQPSLAYCYRTFVNNVVQAQGGKIDVDIDWERKVDAAPSTDPLTRDSIKAYLKELSASSSPQMILNCFAGLMRVAFTALTWNNRTGMEGCQNIFADLLALCPRNFIEKFGFGSSSDRLFLALRSNNEHIRSRGARCFGILTSYQLRNDMSVTVGLMDRFEVLTKIAREWKSAVGSEINVIHGAIKALGFTLSRFALREKFEPDFEPHLKSLHQVLIDILEDSTDNTLLDAAYSAIEQLSIFSVYRKFFTPDAEAMTVMIDKISERAQTGNEKAIIALGRLSICLEETDAENSPLKVINEKIYKLHEIRQMEAQFSVGEAISCLACGWDSGPLRLELDMESEYPSPPKQSTLNDILKRTIADCRASKPSLRKASVIWLLCLVQFCGHLQEVREQLRACQAAFKKCLSDRDELVQEAASRGLGLVYEKGDRGLKDDLVRDLVGSFSDNKTQLAGNVTDETELFEPGTLPTGDGSVTTYKDILSLASEVGDASLVYRFMSLAANNAIWSTRAAFGRFGLSSVFSDSSVDGYLATNPKIYPKLFRYRFDPNPNVQRSMNDIWNALVKDNSATIEKYFDAIMDDLLENILTKEWRVRQACCAAIADLVQGRQFSTYEKYLSQIWTVCFKVLDDIKESVRNAAASLARVLTGILVRNLEAGDSSAKSAESMLQNVLPFLLSTSGLESSAEAVQSFSLSTLLQIVKKGSARILRPFIPELVERMLGLLSSLEPEAINYLHLNASKYNLTEGKIDDMRLNSVRASPMMEGVERCLDLLDDESMAKTVISLKNAMKTTIGLPSRVGCSRVLVSLSTRHRQLFLPYADQFLKLIEKYVLDRNETVSSSYAVSAGYVARLASDEQILQLSQFATKLYCNSDNERHRAVSADIIHAISKHATDRFGNLAVDLLPFVFIAKHDDQEDVAELCEQTWSSNVGGSRAVSLYLKEITVLSLEMLDSPRWNLKHAAARAIANAADALASAVGGIPKEQAEMLWPALRKSLEGKTWDGKEAVVKAFVRFVETCNDETVRGRITPSIVEIILREARRQNKAYQQASIPALGRIAAALQKTDATDWFVETSKIVSSVIEEMSDQDENAMEIDAGSGKNDDRTRDTILSGAIEALQKSFQPCVKGEIGARLNARSLEFLNMIRSATKVRSSGVYAASFEALEAYFKKLREEGDITADSSTQTSEFAQTIHALFFHKDHAALTEAVRLKRAKSILAFANLSIPADTVTFVLTKDKSLNMDVQNESAVAVRQVLEQARGKIQ